MTSSMEICPSVEDIDIIRRVDILQPGYGGCYNIEFHPEFLSFVLVKEVDFEYQVKYSDIVSIFVLPKITGFPSYQLQPKTFVILTLKSPVISGVGSSLYVVAEFKMDISSLASLSLNEDCKGDLEFFVKGVSSRSRANVTFQGEFRSCLQDYAVTAIVGATVGFLYPLEDRFLFTPTPPICMMYEKIVSVELLWRPIRNYFDLLVRTTTDEKYLLFELIRSDEHLNLFNYLKSRGLNVLAVDRFQEGGDICATLYSISEQGEADEDEDDDEEDGSDHYNHSDDDREERRYRGEPGLCY